LVLEILKQGETLKMSVFEQMELALTIRHYSQCRVAFTEIEDLCREIISILNKGGQRAGYQEDLSKGLIKAGQLLWEHLLTWAVKDKLKAAKTQDLILSIDEELIDIPWELLHDGTNFLCLTFNLGRIIRTKEQVAHPQYRSLSSVLKMLILANPTNDLRAAYLEGVNIKNQFDRKRNLVRIDFKSSYIDKLYVKRNLCDYDIVHFAGHAEFEPDNPNNSGWVLSDARFTTQDILAMGSAVSLPMLIFSNACHSAINAAKSNYSLASAFLFSGVRHYIGAIQKIEDPAGLTFSREFYARLLSGKSIGESLRLARLSLMQECGISALHWANYLLYGDPNFVLFRAVIKERPERIKKAISLDKKRITRFSLAAAIVSICIYLYMWLPTRNPDTYVSFLRLQRLFQKGDNQQVITLADNIVKKDPLFLAVYPLLGDTYQRIGDRENALKYYFDYALLSEKRRDKKNLTSAYIGLGWIYHLYAEYAKAFDFYNKAMTLSRENKDRLNEAIVLRKIAVWHMDKAEYDKALELLTKSSGINHERQAKFEHRYNLACDYFNMGLLFTNKEDLVTAKEFYNKSLKLFERLRLKRELSDYYFNLGEIYRFEKQYQRALDCYSKGLKIDKALNNLFSIASDYDMLGELYVEMDNLAEAEKYFEQAKAAAEQINAPLEFASAQFNLGLLYKQKGYKNKARECFRQAQEIYSRIDTPDYQNVKQELLTLD